jgi:integrase
MKLCGHSDIKTTMDYYLKFSDANEQRAMEALDEMMRVVG